jgi:hypothetical protein
MRAVMDYKDEAYKIIRANPGIILTKLWDNMSVIVKDEYDNKTRLGNMIANFPFGLGDEASLGSIYRATSRLEDEGLIRSEIINRMIRYYPTGKRPPQRSHNLSVKLSYA